MKKQTDKPLVWLSSFGAPPMSKGASRDAAFAVRRLQRGELLSLPLSRPMPEIGPRVNELRIPDGPLKTVWRIIYRIDTDAIIIVESFAKKTGATPEPKKKLSRKRLGHYDKNS